MDPLTLAMLAVLAVLIFFMFRNSRKRKADLERLKSEIVPGVEIMTNFGMFGTLLSIDEISNVAEVETSPGTVVRLHRQTISRVVNADEADTGAPRSVEEAMARANAEAEQREREAADEAGILAAEPAFGERTEEPAPAVEATDEAPADDSEAAPLAKKPRSRAKKVDE